MKSIWGGALLLVLLVGLTVLGISCKGDSNPMNPGGGGANVIINIVADLGGNAYSPSPDTVTVGQKVAWRNMRGMTHTATSDVIGAFNTGDIAPGATSAAIQMNTAGNFPYHCVHHAMSGTLFVKP